MHTITTSRTIALIVSLALTLNVDSANAQVTRRRGSSTGRIVGGVIAAIVVLLLLLFLCTCAARRRRASRVNNMATGGPGYTNNTGTGWGFNRFGRGGGGGGFFGGKQNYDNTSTLPQHQQPVGAGYGNDPYTTAPAGTGGGFSNTAPPPPYGKDGATYAVPPGPPPPAHTTGQNGQFVGGFRS